MTSNCNLRELERDTVLAYFGNVLFSDPVRLLGMESICPGALYPLLRKLTE